MRLKDRTAIITGAAGNIGLAVARKFRSEGANLVLADRDAAALERLEAALGGAGVLPVVADVTRADDNRRMVEAALDRFGRLDIFFGNAGIEGVVSPIEDYPQEVFERVFAVNVTALQLGLAAVLPRIADGGAIVLTSSIAGLLGSAGNIAYSASKHAVIGLMRSAAAAGGPRGIRANSVHPGFVDSEMLHRLIAQNPDPEFGGKLIARTKLGRFVTVEEVADAVCFLASDESRAITAQTLVVDGGVVH